MTSMTFTGNLLEKVQRSSDTTSFRFSRPPDYVFEPGQFVGVTVSSPEGPLKHYFSHCDSPQEKHLEVTTRLTGSDFKNALDALPLGGEARFEGPLGKFLFRYDAPKIAFLTGGIGITPVRSMLRHLVETGGAGRIEGQELVLIYGSMTEDGIIYREELDHFSQTIPGLRIVHVITNPSDAWDGHQGFITANIVQSELGDPTAWVYYIVGPPPMITAMERIMEELRIPKTQTVVEGFAGYTS